MIKLPQINTAAALAAGLALATGFAAPPPRPPNIVFVLIDDWGWTDAGCYGSDFYETPQIDRLAADGVKFTRAYSACTVCSPSRAALLTGKYPARLHLTDWIPGYQPADAKLRSPDWTKRLALEERTIAEELKDRGYVTGLVGKWHLGGAGFGPEQQGFEVNFGGSHVGSPRSFFPPYGLAVIKDERPGEMLSDRLTAEALAFIRQNKDRPFFLYLSHYAVHTPVAGKPEVVEKYRRKLARGAFTHSNPDYAALVESVDDSVGAVRAALGELGLAENTIIVLTGDNGGLTGRGKAPEPTRNDPLRAGKGSAYEGGVRVPLIVLWPGVTRAGGVCGSPAGGIDLFPTMLEMADRGRFQPPAVDGMSLAPLLRAADPAPGGRRLFWHYPHYHPGGATPHSVVRDGDWKLIHFYEDGRDELYNLATDLGETRDLAAREPARAAPLRGMLDDWLRATGAQFPVARVGK